MTKVPRETLVPKEVKKSKIEEKFINYTCTKKLWDHNEIIIDSVFLFTIATKIKSDFEPNTVYKCKQKLDWSQ